MWHSVYYTMCNVFHLHCLKLQAMRTADQGIALQNQLSIGFLFNANKTEEINFSLGGRLGNKGGRAPLPPLFNSIRHKKLIFR